MGLMVLDGLKKPVKMCVSQGSTQMECSLLLGLVCGVSGACARHLQRPLQVGCVDNETSIPFLGELVKPT